MADKIQPVSKPVPHPGGMVYGSGKEGKDAKGGSSMMGKK